MDEVAFWRARAEEAERVSAVNYRRALDLQLVVDDLEAELEHTRKEFEQERGYSKGSSWRRLVANGVIYGGIGGPPEAPVALSSAPAFWPEPAPIRTTQISYTPKDVDLTQKLMEKLLPTWEREGRLYEDRISW